MRDGQVCTSPAVADVGRDVSAWQADVHARMTGVLAPFVRDRCAEQVRGVLGGRFVTELLVEFVTGGKCVRPMFTYLGWLCGAAEDDAAARAAASTELLHAFALVQDDVMDRAPLRRGRPAVHVRLADWHSKTGLSGSAARFGESAAVLLADLCLVWAEQLLRGSGLPATALARGWPRYDALRGELAIGQFADLLGDVRDRVALADVLDVARRKSGNYTVRRPLELGAELAGCDAETLEVLGGYGALVGEAYQLRDDVLGVFGEPATTGKSSGGDLAERKPTSLIVVADELAGSAQRDRMRALAGLERLTDAEVTEWRALIAATGAADEIERMITERVERACALLTDGAPTGFAADVLRDMALRCTDRDG